LRKRKPFLSSSTLIVKHPANILTDKQILIVREMSQEELETRLSSSFKKEWRGMVCITQ
jgi:hypothetical protein